MKFVVSQYQYDIAIYSSRRSATHTKNRSIYSWKRRWQNVRSFYQNNQVKHTPIAHIHIQHKTYSYRISSFAFITKQFIFLHRHRLWVCSITFLLSSCGHAHSDSSNQFNWYPSTLHTSLVHSAGRCRAPAIFSLWLLLFKQFNPFNH